MGLPSGVQWASCNVGAARPSELGLFFSWGNIVGHDVEEGYDFSQEVYNSTPAAEIETDLSVTQDAARAYLGAPWRMPTAAEFQELYANCTNVWTSVNGINGLLFTSNVNGNSVFFPAAGYFNGSSYNGRGAFGDYWSLTYSSTSSAYSLASTGSGVTPDRVSQRRLGFSVRAVMPSV